MGPGWRQRPRTFAPQASVMAAGLRDDVGHEYTCFMRGGEDACLHGRFIRSGQVHGRTERHALEWFSMARAGMLEEHSSKNPPRPREKGAECESKRGVDTKKSEANLADTPLRPYETVGSTMSKRRPLEPSPRPGC